MSAIFWKEMRRMGFYLAGAGLAMLGLALLLRSPHFSRGFVSSYWALFLWLALTVTAAALGASQISGERHARSLDFLLVRPISQGAIVWAKFLAGSLTLIPLTMAIVSVGYWSSEPDSIWIAPLQHQASFVRMWATLFPRYWCIYAITLLFSAVLDRTVKVACMMVALAVGILWTADKFSALVPFSHFPRWLPYLEGNMGLVLAARSVQTIVVSGLAFGLGALALTWFGAALLKRSPERYAGTLGGIAMALALGGAAWGSVQIAATRLPELKPIASLELPDLAADLIAGDQFLALANDVRIRFYDTSHPEHLRETATVEMANWAMGSIWGNTPAASVDNQSVLMSGVRTMPDGNHKQIAVVRPGTPVETLDLGLERPKQSAGVPVAVGDAIYVAMTQDRTCSVHVFDRGSQREVARVELAGTIPYLLVDGSYLYAMTTSALTTLDVRDPLHPTVASRQSRAPEFLLGYPMSAVIRDRTLYLTDTVPSRLLLYDLADPTHPMPARRFDYHDANLIWSGTRGLYRGWQQGLMRFENAKSGLRPLRYLAAGGQVKSVAVNDDLVFVLTREGDEERRWLKVFRD